MVIRNSANLTQIVKIPPVKAPDSMMFGYPTRMVDAWNPSVERLLMPGFTDDARTIRLTIDQDHLTYAKLSTTENTGLWPNFKQKVKKILHYQGETVYIHDKIVVDFRHLYTSNLAHFVHRIILNLCIISNNMEKIDLEKDILCIFPNNPDYFTLHLINYFKLTPIFTDSPVCGNIVSLEDTHNNKNVFYGAIHLLTKYPIPNYNPDTPEKVFISRRNTRVLLNENKISDFLAELGYEHLYFEDLDLKDQFSIGRNATDVVAIHGAALGVLAFNATALREPMRRNARKLRLIELFSPAFVVSPFRRYTAALEGQWVGVRGQITPKIVKELDDWNGVSRSAFQPFKIDLTSLQLALDYNLK